MPFPEFDPVLVQLGPLPIRWYALAYVAGIALGWWYAARLIRTERIWAPLPPPITVRQLDDLMLWIVLGIILGGRLGFALFYQPELYAQLFTGPTWADRLELFQVWTGGMSFHGGFLGVVIGMAVWGLTQKAPLLGIADMAAPVAPIGLFFGRVANFINGELWGRETTLPWGVRFCNERIREIYGVCPAGANPRHPSQLYEAALEGLLLFTVLSVAIWKYRQLKRPGMVFGLFLVGYGVSRALLETVRQPDVGLDDLPLGLTMGMLLSIPMIVIGAVLIWRARTRPAPPPPAPPASEDPETVGA